MEFKHESLWPIVHSRLREYMTASNWDIETVADGTDSTPDTVAGWLAGREAIGERLIRLWHLLAALGCDSPELDELKPINFLCGQLLTFGVVSMDELHDTISVSKHQAVLRMLRGSDPLRWCLTYEELIELYEDQLQAALARLPKLDATADPKPATQERVPSLSAAGRIVEGMSVEGENLLVAAAVFNAALPLARHLDSDDCSAEQRSSLRRLIGEENMFDLSNHLNNLCSERAREQGRSGKR